MSDFHFGPLSILPYFRLRGRYPLRRYHGPRRPHPLLDGVQESMAKRSRTEDSGGFREGRAPKARAVLKKHSELWFDDGNVILVVGTTGFKVYRGILSNASVVFRDMFTVPQPPDVETMEDCPVVRLEDLLEDMEYFLMVLFMGSHVLSITTGHDLWKLTRAMLRLGDKYQAEDIPAGGKDRLADRFPDNIPAWDVLKDADAAIMGEGGDVIEMANIAHMLKLESIHLRALYDCCQLPSDMLVRGCPGGGSLCADDLISCLNARTSLAEVRLSLVMEPFDPTRLCDDRTDCGLSLFESRNELRDDYADFLGHDPLVATPWISGKCRGTCKECTEYYVSLMGKKRQRILDDLATFIIVEYLD